MLDSKRRKGNPLWRKTKDAAGKRIYLPTEDAHNVHAALRVIEEELRKNGIDASNADNRNQVKNNIPVVPSALWNQVASVAGSDNPEHLRQRCVEALRFELNTA